jgi:dihydroorotase-like cyclic amidohydrolase
MNRASDRRPAATWSSMTGTSVCTPVGYDADVTVVDLKRRETITNAWIASRCGWTPYDATGARRRRGPA